jgi:hypothetical protein
MEMSVPGPADIPNARRPPDWAVERAVEELLESTEWSIIAERAWGLVRAAAERDDERHDEYDDPDQGGEA